MSLKPMAEFLASRPLYMNTRHRVSPEATREIAGLLAKGHFVLGEFTLSSESAHGLSSAFECSPDADAIVATKSIHGEAELSLDPAPGSTDLNEASTRLASPDLEACVELEDPGDPHVKTRWNWDRYEKRGFVDGGGGGEVHRLWDRELHRTVVIKIIDEDSSRDHETMQRFIAEARITARLQHPSIVPIHELGRLPDQRLYYIMEEVHGHTVVEVIREVHADSGPEEQRASPSGWTFRRLVDVFRRVCEAMAFAHDRGIVHRDLKPGNVMVGTFGEVRIIDWGLARVVGDGASSEAHDRQVGAHTTPIKVHGLHASVDRTRPGVTLGTPPFMSPEQARGKTHLLGPGSDVYSLGALLYNILTGMPPYVGENHGDIVAALREGPPVPPAELAGRSNGQPIDETLESICLVAMARSVDRRYPSAKALATDVGRWLDGVQRRNQALKVMERAEGLPAEIVRLKKNRDEQRRKAALEQLKLGPHAPIDRKRSVWAREEEAERSELEAALKEVEYQQALHGALTHYPDLCEAHRNLARFYFDQHRQAERRGARRAAVQFEQLLRTYDRGEYAAYLKGDGALSLHTDPDGAEAELFRVELRDRRLVETYERRLGVTPLNEVSLERGSYVVRLTAPGRAAIRYPVHIDRREHWGGVPPGATEAYPIRMPHVDELDQDDVYVPAGWWWSGGDSVALLSLPRKRLWLDGLIIRRFPVTNREYLMFLNDLVARGDEEMARMWAPRHRGGGCHELGPLIYDRTSDGCFVLHADADGNEWTAHRPVVMVDWYGARACAAWLAEASGRSWRLPGELEWEKAARGVDGRFCPWGDYVDPTWACLRESFTGRPWLVEVDTFPYDSSPYTVRGLGGNVRDWCDDAFEQEGPPVKGYRVVQPSSEPPTDVDAYRVLRGGAWTLTPMLARAAYRYGNSPGHRSVNLGFRLARAFGT